MGVCRLDLVQVASRRCFLGVHQIAACISATFHVDVARAHFDGHGDRATTGVLLRQVVPVERLFMTYLETGAMNRHYKEAEAVLIFEAGTRLFVVVVVVAVVVV